MVNLCVPCLNRYDLLSRLIMSAENGTLVPDRYYVIDNGGKFNSKFNIDEKVREKIFVQSPGQNVGVAASWNWFINIVPHIRIISNDDMEFTPTAIETFVNGLEYGKVCSNSIANMFSFFYIDEDVVKRVGFFDELISPNYGYFEDNDYYYRMVKNGVGYKIIENVLINHTKSSTMQNYTEEELKEHHRKFQLARNNYVLKHGGLPGEETK